LFFHEGYGSLLHTAGRCKMVTLDKGHKLSETDYPNRIKTVVSLWKFSREFSANYHRKPCKASSEV